VKNECAALENKSNRSGP